MLPGDKFSDNKQTSYGSTPSVGQQGLGHMSESQIRARQSVHQGELHFGQFSQIVYTLSSAVLTGEGGQTLPGIH